MALNNVMFDMRRFAKTKRLMDIEDPEKADEAINRYVAKQVQAAAVGGDRVRARVNETLETLRNTVYMGHIKTTDNAQQVARISLLMQQVGEGQLEETEQARKTLQKTGDAIKENLPSMDSIIAAVTTANPLVGYGIKMMRDVGRAAVQTRKDRKKVVETQLKTADQKLKEQKGQQGGDTNTHNVTNVQNTPDPLTPNKVVTKNQDADKVQTASQTLVPQKGGKPVKRDADRRVPDRSTWLYNYRMSIFEKLAAIESLDETSQTKFEMIGERTDKNNFYLERIAHLLKEDVELTKKLERGQRFSSIEAGRESPVKVNESVSSTEGQGKTKSLLDMLKGGPAALMGGIGAAGAAAFGAAMAKIGSIVRSITHTGAKLGRLGLRTAGRGFPLTAAALSLWDFGKGFINAGEVTGKEENNLWDRVNAGRASLLGGFVTLFDDLTNLMGIDVVDSENIEQRIYQSIEGMKETIKGKALGLIESIKSYMPDFNFSEIHESVTNGMMSIKDKIMDRVSSVWDAIIDAIPSWDEFKQGFKDLFEFESGPTNYPRNHPLHNPTGSMPSQSMGQEMRNANREQRGEGSDVNVNNVNSNVDNSSTTIMNGDQRSRNNEPLSRQTFNMPSINLAW